MGGSQEKVVIREPGGSPANMSGEYVVGAVGGGGGEDDPQGSLSPHRTLSQAVQLPQRNWPSGSLSSSTSPRSTPSAGVLRGAGGDEDELVVKTIKKNKGKKKKKKKKIDGESSVRSHPVSSSGSGVGQDQVDSSVGQDQVDSGVVKTEADFRKTSLPQSDTHEDVDGVDRGERARGGEVVGDGDRKLLADEDVQNGQASIMTEQEDPVSRGLEDEVHGKGYGGVWGDREHSHDDVEEIWTPASEVLAAEYEMDKSVGGVVLLETTPLSVSQADDKRLSLADELEFAMQDFEETEVEQKDGPITRHVESLDRHMSSEQSAVPSADLQGKKTIPIPLVITAEDGSSPGGSSDGGEKEKEGETSEASEDIVQHAGPTTAGVCVCMAH